MRFGETPVPIPNTTVKTGAAESTILVTVWEDRWPPDLKKENGGVAQLGERLLCTQEVSGSIPLGSIESTDSSLIIEN